MAKMVPAPIAMSRRRIAALISLSFALRLIGFGGVVAWGVVCSAKLSMVWSTVRLPRLLADLDGLCLERAVRGSFLVV